MRGYGGDRYQIGTIVLGLIMVKIILLFVLAWNSLFVMDEFGQLGYAKYLFRELFDTIQPSKAAGSTAFFKLAHLVGWDATSILLVGRIQTALLGCAIVAMVYACARALGEDRVRALSIVLVLLCFSNFMERVFRTIAEPLAVFFAVAALLVVVRAHALSARHILAAGVLSGLAFLATQKSVYFNVALGLGLVTDAAMMRRYSTGLARGACLVLGWTLSILAYCFVFGGSNPVPIAESLVFGPIEVATRGGVEYGGLRHLVLQTLLRNVVLYVFCFSGMALSLMRFRQLEERNRIALIFSIVITVLVFIHDQPWPYVFIMALPFMSLWSLAPLDRIVANTRYFRIASVALVTAVVLSFVSNIVYLRFNNAAQLELVARAESLLAAGDRYFDGIGMLPNRSEPSTLWLDRHYVLATLRQGDRSEAYEIFSKSPPKMILWSYRTEYIYPVIAPLIQNSYVTVAPNLRIAGRRLYLGEHEVFDVPIPGVYGLYSATGTPLRGAVDIDGTVFDRPVHLSSGRKAVTLRTGSGEALLLPQGSYAGRFKQGSDNLSMFANAYN